MKLFADVIVSMAIVAMDIFYIEAKPSNLCELCKET